MTTPPTRTRRIARNVAVGAVAVSAGIALPAMALDSGDDTPDVGAEVSLPEAAPSTTTTTIDPAEIARMEQEQVDAWWATVAAMTPEEQFALAYQISSPEQQSDFDAWIASLHGALGYVDEVSRFLEGQEQARQAEAARQEAARQEGARQEAARQQAARQQAARQPAAPQRSAAAPSVSGGGVWDTLAQCEAGGNWAYPTVSGGFSGGLMFHYKTWNGFGGQAYAPAAHQATRDQQIAVAQKVLASQGWNAWPGCSRKLGLR